MIVLQQSFDITDSYYNQNYVHVDTDITIDKKNINIVSVIGARRNCKLLLRLT